MNRDTDLENRIVDTARRDGGMDGESSIDISSLQGVK